MSRTSSGIVIQLKQRSGGGPPDRDSSPEKDEPPRRGAPARRDDDSDSEKSTAGEKHADRSQSRDRSVEEDLPPVVKQPAAHVLDHPTLKGILSNFSEEFEKWVKDASAKLKQQEAASKQSRQKLRDSADLVKGFLREFAPDAYSDAFGDGGIEDIFNGASEDKSAKARKVFTQKALPSFLDHVVEDQKALKESISEMKSFADKYFPHSKDTLHAETAPVPLFKTILKLLNEAKGLETKDSKPDGEERRGGSRRKNDRDGGRRAKDSKSPEPRDGKRGGGGGRRNDSRSPPRRGGGGRDGGRDRSRSRGGRGGRDGGRPRR